MKTTETGFIYVLSNPSMPGKIKVGRTTLDPAERARQLSGTTGVPEPFVVEHQWRVLDLRRAERLAHRSLADARSSPRREFFDLDPDQARSMIERAIWELQLDDHGGSLSDEEIARLRGWVRTMAEDLVREYYEYDEQDEPDDSSDLDYDPDDWLRRRDDVTVKGFEERLFGVAVSVASRLKQRNRLGALWTIVDWLYAWNQPGSWEEHDVDEFANKICVQLQTLSRLVDPEYVDLHPRESRALFGEILDGVAAYLRRGEQPANPSSLSQDR